VEQAETLRTIAEVATAFAGFSGVLVVLGRRTEREWAYAETMSITLLLLYSLGAVLFAFVPLLVEAAGLPVWRVSAGLFAAFHLTVLIGSLRSYLLAGAPLIPRWIIAPAATVALGFLTFNLLIAAGFFQSLAFFGYLVALVWFLAWAALMFAALLFESRRGTAEPAAASR
jgi:hypothetical protein